MKNILALEIKKSIRNKLFFISVIVGCGITLLSFFYNQKLYQQAILASELMASNITENPHSQMTIVFNSWIGGERFSLGTAIFFFIFPLLVAIPYGWSFSEEKISHYHQNLVVQVGKRAYFFSKYVAVFLSGALAMVLPLVFNFILSLLVFPSLTPLVIYDIYYGVFSGSLMAQLYYETPFLYVAVYLLIDFIYGGLIACLALTASSFIRQQWVVVIVPFFICLAIHYSTRFVYTSPTTVYQEYSPLNYLRPVQSAYATSWAVIVGIGISLFLITFLLFMKWEQSRENY